MCDYSLQGLPNRLAVEGEELVTHRFITGSTGLASSREMEAIHPGDGRRSWWKAFKTWLLPELAKPVTAVCVAPGTRLLMRQVPEPLARELKLRPVEEVLFTQTSLEEFQYRDAIQVTGNRHVLLQNIPEGVRFDVLPAPPRRGENWVRSHASSGRAPSERTRIW